MKKILVALVILQVFMIFSACGVHTTSDGQTLIRIHIRANSNEKCDQSVKLLVRDEISAFLEAELEWGLSYGDAYREIEKRVERVNQIALAVLKKNGFDYGAKTRLNCEYFPTRAYGETVVSSGYYDALIVELGDAKGDNWWCVIYPPLCFLGASGEGEIQYRSLILEFFSRLKG